MIDRSNYSLLQHNTFGIDARCAQYLEPQTLEEVQGVAALLRTCARYIIIGGGSNLLLTRDYDGVVVRVNLRGIELSSPKGRSLGDESSSLKSSEVLITCGAGETWDDVVDYCVAHELYGAENLSLIPGDVGASAVQNIGAYGVEVSELIESVEAVEIATGRVLTIAATDCDYAYRWSRFKGEWRGKYLITRVTYRLSRDFEPRLSYFRDGFMPQSERELRERIIAIRREKLPEPSLVGNAGSFFMNPIVAREVAEALKEQYPAMPVYPVDNARVKLSAGWMIEQCGWKGRSLGRAGVYEKQALVLVNRGGATGAEIVALCDAVQRAVRAQFGIELSPEVNII